MASVGLPKSELEPLADFAELLGIRGRVVLSSLSLCQYLATIRFLRALFFIVTMPLCPA